MLKHNPQNIPAVVDCACVIHGSAYDWTYVERLYSMLQKNIQSTIRFHVFTEPNRPVPKHMIKHELKEWPGIAGPKKSWWYKMQMFDPAHVPARLLYLDLDVVIVRDISWMWELDSRYFWTIQDFRYLWRPNWKGINSSIMLWDVPRWAKIWADFQSRNIAATVKQFHGDQDFLNIQLGDRDLRFFDSEAIKSWRWQLKDGGLDMKTRVYKRPDAGTVLDPTTDIMIFHGSPKPHEVHDAVIDRFWVE